MPRVADALGASRQRRDRFARKLQGPGIFRCAQRLEVRQAYDGLLVAAERARLGMPKGFNSKSVSVPMCEPLLT